MAMAKMVRLVTFCGTRGGVCGSTWEDVQDGRFDVAAFSTATTGSTRNAVGNATARLWSEYGRG